MTDTAIHFTDNNIEAQIGHMTLPRSGNKERSNRGNSRTKILIISPLFYLIQFIQTQSDHGHLKLLIIPYVFMMDRQGKYYFNNLLLVHHLPQIASLHQTLFLEQGNE